MIKMEAERLAKRLRASLQAGAVEAHSYGRGLWTVVVHEDEIEREYRSAAEYEAGTPARERRIEDVPWIDTYPIKGLTITADQVKGAKIHVVGYWSGRRGQPNVLH